MSSATTPKPWSLATRLTVGFAATTFVLVLLTTAALDWRCGRNSTASKTRFSPTKRQCWPR